MVVDEPWPRPPVSTVVGETGHRVTWDGSRLIQDDHTEVDAALEVLGAPLCPCSRFVTTWTRLTREPASLGFLVAPDAHPVGVTGEVPLRSRTVGTSTQKINLQTALPYRIARDLPRGRSDVGEVFRLGVARSLAEALPDMWSAISRDRASHLGLQRAGWAILDAAVPTLRRRPMTIRIVAPALASDVDIVASVEGPDHVIVSLSVSWFAGVAAMGRGASWWITHGPSRPTPAA